MDGDTTHSISVVEILLEILLYQRNMASFDTAHHIYRVLAIQYIYTYLGEIDIGMLDMTKISQDIQHDLGYV